jgi:uncharacterized protein YutD
VYKIIVGKWGIDQLGIAGNKLEDNIKIDCMEMVCM